MRLDGKKPALIVLTAVLLMTLPAASGRAASAVRQQFDTDKIAPTLRDAMRNAQAGKMLPVVILMAEQAPDWRMAELRAIANKSVRRAAVIDLLKSTARRTQADLLGVLEAAQTAGRVGASVRPLWLSNVIVADMTPAAIEQIAARDDIASLHLESMLGDEVFPVEPSDGEIDVDQAAGDSTDGPVIECGVALMGAPRVWDELGITGSGSVVCVIDTGCCITHRDLVNQIWVNAGEIPGNGIDDDNNGYVADINGWNFWERNNNLADTSGHGTHVSGTVAGDGTSGQQTGMAPDAKLMTCRYFVSFAGESTIWESMQYAVDNGADIITVSSGWPHSVNPQRAIWRAECENAMAAGLAVLYAAGNEGACCRPFDAVRTPGDVPDVITVGAVNCADFIASFSSRGPVTWQNVSPYNDWPYPPGKLKPTISAPGVDTLSTSVCSGYRRLSGTSMATPHVAGAVALMLEANPNLDHFQIKQILKDTAVDLGEPGPDNSYGAGRVDAYEAVLMALKMGGGLGDLNCDGVVDTFDIEPFLVALFEPLEYSLRYPDCDIMRGDTNRDGSVTAFDIESFLDLLFP